MTHTNPLSGINIGGEPLVKDLGIAIGIITADSTGDTFTFNKDWIEDPIKSLEALPNDADRRAAVVKVFDDVWDDLAVDSPLQDASGTANPNKWLPIPKSLKDTKEQSGLFFVPEDLSNNATFGLGLMHETSLASGKFTLSPFAFFPMLEMPFQSGSPLIFGKSGHPIPVGATFRFPEKKITYKGTDYNGFKVIVNFDISAPTTSTVNIYLAKADGGFDPFTIDFTDLTEIVNDLLGFGEVTTWLDKPIITDNPNKTGLGKILTSFGLLENNDNVYSLGSLDTIKNLTFTKLLHIALSLLDGLQILKLGEKGKEGLFIVGTKDGDTTDYGFRFVLTDIELGKKEEEEGGNNEAAAEASEEGEDEKKPNQLLLQIGKAFEKDPPKKEGGDSGDDGSDSGNTTALFAASADEEGNWTNSEEPLGINLYIVSDDGSNIKFNPRLDLVSVGIDYKSAGEDPIASGAGFSFTGMEPRMFISIQPLETPVFQFGAAMRIDHIELPLDAGVNANSEKGNPVVSNLLASKSEEKSEPGDKTTPPARTQFSFAAGYTPIADTEKKQHHFNAFLYNKENEATTKPIWWQLEKSFGPIALEKVGISWDNAPRDLGLYLSGGLHLSSLQIDLDQLSITFPLTDIEKTELGLKGLSLFFQGGPVTIAGSFAEVDGAAGKEYDGDAEIKAGTFGIAAIGSYASVDDHPSLFIFALLDVPLGGPPFFFVTGLAAGFGYNRDLKIPTIDELPKFPLVSAALAGATGDNPFKGSADDPNSALSVIKDYVPPDYGEDWLAVGVRFTSFELVQSFALLSVAFGTKFELALLGLASISMPPSLPPEKDPIAFAELALRVVFSPDDGILAVEAKLTPQSYVLSKDCHLTGGFAFYIWSKDDPKDPQGYKAGDFVITLGGYNPHYKKPKFFPDEPRLGFNWKIGTTITIEGGLYFALTPSAVMAGGSLSAVWKSGPLKAWFSLWADFLLSWKPFYYYLDAGIDLGASLHLKILFINVNITIHVGVDLELWGPSFGGQARVHLFIISFTIRFGSKHPDVQAISWDDFKASFLPPDSPDDSGGNGGGKVRFMAVPQVSLCHLDAVTGTPSQIPTHTKAFVRPGASGLVKDLSKDPNNQTGLDWILQPEGLQLITHTAIPAKSATLVTGNGNGQQPAEKEVDLVQQLGLDPSAVDIGPSGVVAANIISHHQISVYRLEADQHDLAYDFSAHGTEEAVLGNSPRATWNAEMALKPSLEKANTESLNIQGTLNGFILNSKLLPPDHTQEIDISSLQYETAPTEPTFEWSDPGIETVDPQPGANGTTVLMQTINDPTVSATRSAILAALIEQGIQVADSVSVADLAKSADQVLIHAPELINWKKKS